MCPIVLSVVSTRLGFVWTGEVGFLRLIGAVAAMRGQISAVSQFLLSKIQYKVAILPNSETKRQSVVTHLIEDMVRSSSLSKDPIRFVDIA